MKPDEKKLDAIHRLVDKSELIRDAPPTKEDTAYLTRYLIQATLPHRQPKGNPPEWYRINGNYTLSLRPGYTTDPTSGTRVCLGYPCGSIPRLIMCWVTTEAIRTKSRKLQLGRSLSEFMRELGLNPRNGTGVRSDAVRLRDQMERLFRATISFEYTSVETKRWCDMQVAPEAELWWDPRRPSEDTLWDSWVMLGEKFYEAVLASPVPLDVRVLRELKASPLALDLYAWATYRTYTVNRAGKPSRVSWRQLHAQLGSDYSQVRDFRRRATHALKRVGILYPGLNLRVGADGIRLRPGGKTAIAAL